jgi:hypothetical protein
LHVTEEGSYEHGDFIAGLDDFAAMREAVKECRGHFDIPEDVAPFSEGEVRRDDERDALVW